MNQTYYLHLRQHVYYKNQSISLQSRGGATVAYQLAVANFGGRDHVIVKGGVAVCSQADNFSKKLGREYALLALTGEVLTGHSKRQFLAKVDYLDQLQTRTVDGQLEILHDNEKIRKLLLAEAMKIIIDGDYLFPASFETDHKLQLQIN